MRDYSKTGGRKGFPAYRTPSSFKAKVLNVVRRIPKGKVLTYKKVAQLSGNSHAFRAVGNILRLNYDQQIPCHRVIRSDGKMSGYNRGGSSEKYRKLTEEGAFKKNNG